MNSKSVGAGMSGDGTECSCKRRAHLCASEKSHGIQEGFQRLEPAGTHQWRGGLCPVLLTVWIRLWERGQQLVHYWRHSGVLAEPAPLQHPIEHSGDLWPRRSCEAVTVSVVVDAGSGHEPGPRHCVGIHCCVVVRYSALFFCIFLCFHIYNQATALSNRTDPTLAFPPVVGVFVRNCLLLCCLLC